MTTTRKTLTKGNIEAMATGGKYYPPRFVDVSQNFQFPVSNFQCRQIQVNQKNIDLIKEGMKAACSDGGTAYTFFDFSAKHNSQTVACKTGTAEVGADGIPHAWFTLFSPANDPKIILTVLVERGGQGSQVAGPVARKIADYYFENSN
jgi:cell division protein FtsI/penicillin-binding protein 2